MDKPCCCWNARPSAEHLKWLSGNASSVSSVMAITAVGEKSCNAERTEAFESPCFVLNREAGGKGNYLSCTPRSLWNCRRHQERCAGGPAPWHTGLADPGIVSILKALKSEQKEQMQS